MNRFAEVGLPEPSHHVSRARHVGGALRSRLIAALGVVALAAGCATAPTTSHGPVGPGPQVSGPQVTGQMERGAVLGSLSLGAGLEERILALNPERISEQDVRATLSKGPTPRIILLHGGIYPVHLIMTSFATFLERMGYPEDKLRDPIDGAYSQSPYGNSERLAGEIAWFYEHDGVRPMMIGHSQGGMQAVKVLYELEGAFGDKIAVWNPVADTAEDRTTITDPLTGNTRPVVGVSVAYASAVGAGGAAFLLPNQWNMLHRLRTIPDSVEEFTGFIIPGDLVAWSFPGAPGASHYRHDSAAKVRNVTLPISYNHVTVPITSSLANDPRAREWINAYRPAGGDEEELKAPSDVRGDNILWAADVWFSIKKHWCLEAQQLIRVKRAALAAR
jgi:pimeloyl-ACP methyl ester carboxylesterase